jgi:CRISPR-associated protein Cas5h
MSQTIISVDFHACFGFLKKPDINEGIYLTYNCLHKPALLGILGAIVGLGGYAQSYPAQPEYLKKLEKLKIGIQPPRETKGNIQKTVISYNNSVGYANLDCP